MLKSSKIAQSFSTVFDLWLVYDCEELDVLQGGLVSHDVWSAALSSAIWSTNGFQTSDNCQSNYKLTRFFFNTL